MNNNNSIKPMTTNMSANMSTNISANMTNNMSTNTTNVSTNYLAYSQFIPHNPPSNTTLHLSAQTSPVKIPVISNSIPSGNQLLTDPQAILQKLRPAVNRPPVEQVPVPMLQPNEPTSAASTNSASIDDHQLDQSFIDSWLN